MTRYAQAKTGAAVACIHLGAHGPHCAGGSGIGELIDYGDRLGILYPGRTYAVLFLRDDVEVLDASQVEWTLDEHRGVYDWRRK